MTRFLLLLLLAVPDRSPPDPVNGHYTATDGAVTYRVTVFWVNGWDYGHGTQEGYFATEWRKPTGEMVHAGMLEQLQGGSFREWYYYRNEVQLPQAVQSSEDWRRDANGDWRVGPRIWVLRDGR